MILVTKSLRRGSITMIIPWQKRRRVLTNNIKVVATLMKGLGALLVRSNMG